MRPIQFKQWLIPAIVLIGLGLVIDLYYVHKIFPDKSAMVSLMPIADAQVPASNEEIDDSAGGSSLREANNPQIPADTPAEDNFAQVLAQCNPAAAPLGLQSPDAYFDHYKKSVGVRRAIVELENFHLRLADGSERRVQVLPRDDTNSNSLKEFRVFQLDAQGMPERLPLQTGDTVDRILAQGQVFNRESRERVDMNDGSVFAVEFHNGSIFEFQQAGGSNTFSCRGKDCVCQ